MNLIYMRAFTLWTVNEFGDPIGTAFLSTRRNRAGLLTDDNCQPVGYFDGCALCLETGSIHIMERRAA